ADAPVNVSKLMAFISPVVEKVRSQHGEAARDELLTRSIEANVANSMRRLFDGSEEIRKRVNAGSLKIIGAVYHIAGGQIDWLDIKL
ncbi:hypothetical protein GF324_12875, partial [bacterium]|nr:hypothetical protein [bacterium]